MAEGGVYMDKHDYEAAILSFKNAVRLASDDPEAHYRLGLAYLAHGETTNAGAHIQRATELNPGYAPAQVKLAELMAQSADADLNAARRRVEDVLAASPDEPDALRVIALVDLRQGRQDLAEKNLRQALARHPSFLAAATMLASMKVAAHDFAAAESVLTAAIQADSNATGGVLALGRLHLLEGRLPEAAAKFQQVLASKPGNAQALLGLAAIYVHGKEYVAAGEILRQLGPPGRGVSDPLRIVSVCVG